MLIILTTLILILAGLVSTYIIVKDLEPTPEEFTLKKGSVLYDKKWNCLILIKEIGPQVAKVSQAYYTQDLHTGIQTYVVTREYLDSLDIVVIRLLETYPFMECVYFPYSDKYAWGVRGGALKGRVIKGKVWSDSNFVIMRSLLFDDWISDNRRHVFGYSYLNGKLNWNDELL